MLLQIGRPTSTTPSISFLKTSSPHKTPPFLSASREVEMQADGPYISICPTFNPRSNGNLAAVAAKVAQEQPQSQPRAAGGDNSKPDSESDFAFAFPLATTDSVPPSPIPADQIFRNGQIRPLYPAENQATSKDSDSNLNLNSDSDLHSRSHSNGENAIRNSKAALRNPLRKLFEDKKLTRRAATVDSSLEKNIAEESPTQMYCAYPPPAAAAEETRSRRSIFGGNNPRSWRIVGLLNRIHVRHGERGSFAFLTHSHSERKEIEKKPKDLPPVSHKSKSAQLTSPPP